MFPLSIRALIHYAHLLPQHSWSLETARFGIIFQITPKFNRFLGISTAETPVKFQMIMIIVTSNLAALRLQRFDDKTSYRSYLAQIVSLWYCDYIIVSEIILTIKSISYTLINNYQYNYSTQNETVCNSEICTWNIKQNTDPIVPYQIRHTYTLFVLHIFV